MQALAGLNLEQICHLELLFKVILFAQRGSEEPLKLVAQVSDNGLPKPKRESMISDRSLNDRMMRPPIRITVDKINGLFLSWNVYRGEGKVTFDAPLPKLWEDTRISANSLGGPP